MYLTDIIIINYKSCQNVHLSFDKDTPTVFIGVNDCGKSTILTAIGLLLDSRPKFYYSSDDHKKDDISNSRIGLEAYDDAFQQFGLPLIAYEPNQSVIAGRFCVEDRDIDDQNQGDLSSHLLWAIENAENGVLWLARRFNAEMGKHSDLLLTPDILPEPRKLYNEKSTALGKVKTEFGVTNDDIQNENAKGRFSNLEIIRAIYSKVDLSLQWVDYKVDKGFWPEYRYLDWTMSMDQLNQVVNDILTTRIENQLKKATKVARRKARKAQRIVNEELERMTRVIASDAPSIERLKVNVNFPIESKVTDILINKTNCDGDIHLDSQGEGIKRQLWFSMLKWKSLGSVEEQDRAKKYIWCFDEPETHLYPKAQRDFFEIIRKISISNVQAILSTHSTIFIDRAKLSTIRKVDLCDRYTSITKCNGIDDIYHSLQLKNSDFLFYDRFLLVEGDTEQALIQILYELYSGKKLLADNIQLINLGGKDKRSFNTNILLGLLRDFRRDSTKAVVYIFDRDAVFNFSPAEIQQMGDRAFFIGRQDIEDCISPKVWARYVKNTYEGLLEISEAEIQEMQDCIPIANPHDPRLTSVNQNQKFFPVLLKHIRLVANQADLPNNLLHTKGREHGEALGRLIDCVELIPRQIQEAFGVLQT